MRGLEHRLEQNLGPFRRFEALNPLITSDVLRSVMGSIVRVSICLWIRKEVYQGSALYFLQVMQRQDLAGRVVHVLNLRCQATPVDLIVRI